MRGLSIAMASAVLGGGLLFGAAPASALEIEGYDLWQGIYGGEVPEIHVEFDPKVADWTVVTSDPVKVKFGFELTVKSAYAIDNDSGVTVFLDNFGETAFIHSSNPSLTFGDRIQGSLELSSPGDQTNAFKKAALEVCHTVRSNGGEPDKDHVIPRNYKAGSSLIVGTLAPLSQSQKKDKDIWVQYRVVCEKSPGWQSNSVAGLTTEKGKFKVRSIDLFLTTFHGQETNPNPGTSCKKLKVTVRIETSKSGGPVSYKLWRQPGEPVVKQAMSEFQTTGQFKGRYIIEDSFVETFDKTTYVQYMAEVLNDPFAPSTQWKPITIQCNGGFSTSQPQGGGADIQSFKVTSADLKIISLAGKGCPTKAFVTATFIANKPGTFKYFIGTSLNKNKSGQLEAKKVGNVYRAQETLTLDITKSGKLTAHARPVDFPAASALASKSYNCKGVDPVDGVTNPID